MRWLWEVYHIHPHPQPLSQPGRLRVCGVWWAGRGELALSCPRSAWVLRADAPRPQRHHPTPERKLTACVTMHWTQSVRGAFPRGSVGTRQAHQSPSFPLLSQRNQHHKLLPVRQIVHQRLQSQEIAAPAKTGDLPHTDRGQHGLVAELLPAVDVAQVDFDGGE